MFFLSKIDYRRYKKFDKIAYFGSFLLLFTVLIPGIGQESGGAKRWIWIIPNVLTVQPSEIAKVALVIFFASYLTDNRDKIGEFKEGFLIPLFKYFLPIALVLVLIQSHLSATILICLVIAIMMLMAGSKLRYFITFGTLRSTEQESGALYALAKWFKIGGFRFERILSFLDPWADQTGTGWQVIQGLYAIGSRRTIWSRTWKQYSKILIHTRTTKRLHICNNCRGIRICSAVQ